MSTGENPPPEDLRTRAADLEAEMLCRTREIQEANRKLRAANEELAGLYEKSRELDRLKTGFFANISHELRTPLTMIIGPVDRMLEDPDLPPRRRQDLEVVSRNARGLLRQVNDLLDISRLEADRMEIRHAESDAASLTRLWAGQFEVLAREKNLEFRVDTPGSLPCQIDPEKAGRILLHLFSNAIKFTPAGGRVRCSLRAEGGHLVLEIADSGPGVPPERRQEVLERFRPQEGGSARKFDGAGLGLSIARDFIRLHGGSLAIGDAPEGGALFTVRLPLQAPPGAHIEARPANPGVPEPAAPPAARADGPAAAESGGTGAAGIPADAGKPLVLVVEDNREMSAFIGALLEDRCRIESAFDGAEGLEKALRTSPDLILSDIMMPGMSGDQLLREIRRRPEMDGIPIILLTAKADERLRVDLLKSGAQDYMMKPFSAEELLARAGNLIALKKMREALQADLEARRRAELEARLAEEKIAGLNAALQEHAEELEAANKELETFSYSVSHDLRSPLRSIDGFSRILLEDFAEQLGSEGKRHLETVCRNTQRMSQLIDDLLDFSRLGRQQMAISEIDMRELARSAWEEVRPRDGTRSLTFDLGEMPAARGDPSLLRQVFINLLSNAVKYTGKKPSAAIEVGGRIEGGEAIYFVRDNGAGFNMEYAGKLFGVFQRLHGVTEFEGTGVGLAIVQRIVFRHGGRIRAEGKVGEGAVFHLALPAAR